MAVNTYTYSELLNKVQPALAELSTIKFPKEVPFTQLIDIAENLDKIEKKFKVFWDLRKKLIEEYSEKDKDGNQLTELDANKQTIAKMIPSKLNEYNSRFNELNETKVKLDLRPIAKKNLENVDGLSPMLLNGLLPILS
jgi:hypothetical protein